MLNSRPQALVQPIHLMPAAARAKLTPLAARLAAELKGDVLFDRAARGRYATDASIYQIMPLGVVVPKDQADLTLALDIARDSKAPVLARGVVLDHLNAWLKPHGLWFPVDVSTSAQCTIGGMAGNNSCGSRSMEYGIMVHNVDAIDAILADGHEAHFGKLS